MGTCVVGRRFLLELLRDEPNARTRRQREVGGFTSRHTMHPRFKQHVSGVKQDGDGRWGDDPNHSDGRVRYRYYRDGTFTMTHTYGKESVMVLPSARMRNEADWKATTRSGRGRSIRRDGPRSRRPKSKCSVHGRLSEGRSTQPHFVLRPVVELREWRGRSYATAPPRRCASCSRPEAPGDRARHRPGRVDTSAAPTRWPIVTAR